MSLVTNRVKKMNTEITREFIFATYVKSKYNKNNDLLVIKEKIYKDDKVKNNLKFIENYQRPFYITKPDYRNHNDKKEYEDITKTECYYSNQINLPNSIYYTLNQQHCSSYLNLSKANNSPFVYGTDISTPVLIANEYKEKYPNINNPNTLGVMDYETDMLNGTGKIISGVLSYKNNVHIAVTEEFLGVHKINGTEKILETLNTRLINNPKLTEYLKDRNINFHVSIVKKASDVVRTLFKAAHTLEFDFLGFWNIKFDIRKCIEALKDDNVDPAIVFSDPRVPKEYKYYRWIEDQLIKKKANGDTNSKNPIDLWHSLIAPASFYPICLMATYRVIRNRDPLRNDYSLDGVLKDELGIGKLYFDDIANKVSGANWHKTMQSNYKLEYLAYMVFDAISVELLNEKTKDISHSIKGFIGLSELTDIKSNPKRLADNIYFELLKDNKILGSTSDKMVSKLDEETPSLKGWISALSSELTDNVGLKLINEYPLLETNISTFCFDLDVSSAYPNAEIALNVSKTTRAFETCKIVGLSDNEYREIGINLTNIPNNALFLASKLYNYPDLTTLLEKFNN